jgi:hypothetical protein
VHRRDYQDHAEHELERRCRDQSDEEAPYHRPDNRIHPHRRDGPSKVGAIREEPSLLCLSTPTATVGRLISRLAVPGVLMGAPKAKTSVGKMNSPPATPSELLTNPMPSYKIPAATRRTSGEAGRSPCTWTCGSSGNTW